MAHPVAVAWLFPILGAGTATEVATGIESNARAGLMTIEPGQPSTPGVDFTATLLSGLRLLSQRTTLSLRYRPRYYYQIPNAADSDLPLFLHQMDGTYTTAFSRRTNFSWSANAAAGALSYTSLLQLFPDGTAAAASGFIPLGNASSTMTLGHLFTRNHALTVGANAGYRTLLDNDETITGFPTSLNVGVQVTDNLQVTKLDRVGFITGLTYIDRDLSGTTNATTGLSDDNLVGIATATWERAVDVNSNLTVQAGAAVSGLDGNSPFSAFPTLTGTITDQFHALGGSYNLSFATGARGYFDPLLATFRPQGFLNLSLGGQHGRHVRTQLVLNLSSSLAAKAIDPPQYETNGAFSFTFTYQIARHFGVNAGASWQVRAGHWSNWDTPVLQNQAIGSLGLKYTFGSDNENGSWL